MDFDDKNNIVYYYNIWLNVIDMLKDRKYDSEGLDQYYRNIDFDEFKSMYKDQTLDIRAKHTEYAKDVVVMFTDIKVKKFKKDELNKIIDIAKTTKENDRDIHVIILISDKIQDNMLKKIKEFHDENSKGLEGEKITIEMYPYNQLAFNVTKHEYVPQHILITDSEEKKRILNEYNAKQSEFPKIKSSDPVCKWYGGKHGDLFKIYRVTERSEKSIAYRIVN